MAHRLYIHRRCSLYVVHVEYKSGSIMNIMGSRSKENALLKIAQKGHKNIINVLGRFRVM